MRKTFGIAALALGIATAVVPAAPASAQCWYLGEEFGCVNPCYGADAAYHELDDRAGDKLPDQPFYCTD